MTTAPLPDFVVDTRELLYGAARMDAAEAIGRALRDSGTVGELTRGARRLSGAVGRSVERELATAVDGFLGEDLLDLAASGWQYASKLRAAAHLTRQDPGRTELVPMLTHKITSTQQPKVDLYVDDIRLGTLEVGLTVVFDVEGLLAVVRGGALVGAECARCTTTGTLTVEQITLAQRRAAFDVPGRVRLRRALPLIPAQAGPAGQAGQAGRPEAETAVQMSADQPTVITRVPPPPPRSR
ncbi:hypothetical protein ABT095_22150 [Kitasatospora sp. NPDC002227]|uniref:hypothetical protein n=1 Tax=Kitasatospora sp. NPDC002227 TaxID=3154773 RepID=UPI0033231CAD